MPPYEAEVCQPIQLLTNLHRCHAACWGERRTMAWDLEHAWCILVQRLAKDNSLYGLLTIVLLVHLAMNFSQTSVCDVCKKCGQTSAKRAGCGLHSVWHGDRRIKSNISNAGENQLPAEHTRKCSAHPCGKGDKMSTCRHGRSERVSEPWCLPMLLKRLKLACIMLKLYCLVG